MSEKQLAVAQVNPARLSQDDALNKVLSMWNDAKKVEEIRKIYAPKLSDGEFKTFVEMGIATGLNPFLREIWAVKYDAGAAAQIFIGRDGYRKIISRNECFEGLITESVCANDEFNVDIVKGEVKHIPKIKDRGKLIGAYCIIYMKGVKIPYYMFVPIEEYNTGRSVWKDKPHTMIKKVAECQCIRMADQTCASTYSPDEMPEHKLRDEYSKADDLNKGYKLYEGETIDQETGEVKEPVEQLAALAEPEIPEAPQNECPYTLEQVKEGMINSKDLQTLNDFAAVISNLGVSKEQHAELSKVYRQCKDKLKKEE
jgi:phage recombination protein Bet